MMRRVVLMVVAGLIAPAAVAAGGGHMPYDFEPDLGNQASLQRGAKLYVNYCSGCHSLKYVRYKRFQTDLGIPREVIENNLMLGDAKIGSRIGLGLPERSSNWLSKAPPDLSLAARERGASWIYNFLRTFYLDESSNTGVNNLVLENTAMPHALAPLQGYQKLPESGGGHGEGGPGFEMVQKGSMSSSEYQRAVADITNFLVYVGEPAKMVRYSLGIKVILFLLVFTGIAWLLKREFWRDVH